MSTVDIGKGMFLGRPRQRNITVPTTATGVVASVPTNLSPPLTVVRESGSTSITFAASGANVTASIASTLADGVSISAIARATDASGAFVGIPFTLTGRIIPVVPAAPTVTLTAGNGQVSIAYSPNGNGGATITGYNLYAGASAGSLALLGFIPVASASPYLDTGLTNGVARFYAMSAVNSVGEGPQSAVQSATPTASAVTGDPIAFTVLNASLIDVDGASGYGVNPNGWVAKVTLKGLGTGGTCDATKLSMTVSDPGYDTAGNPTTVTRVIPGHSVLRRQVPNQTQKMIFANGPDVDVYIALGDYIFSGTTIQSVTIQSGFYTGSNASSAGLLTRTNSSARSYWKPHLVWADMPDRRATGTSYGIEAYCAHRYARNGQAVPFVQFIATDGTNTVTATSNAPALSSIISTANKPEVFKGTIPLASLNQGAQISVNAKVYPWIGDSSAVLDLSVDRVAALTGIQQQTYKFVNDRSGSYGGAIAYVNPNAVYTPLSSAAQVGSAANAFNGNGGADGFYSTAIADPYLGMQFPAAVSVRHIRAVPHNGVVGNFPTAVVLEYSNDGSIWTQWGSASAFAAGSTGVYQTWDFGAGAPAATYWRVRRAGGSSNIGFGELEFQPVLGANAVYGYVDATDTLPRSLPCLSIGSAFTKVQEFNNALRGHNDHSGSTIYLMDNAGSAQVHTISTTIATPAGNCWTDIKVDPLATGAVTFTSAALGAQTPDRVKWSVAPSVGGNAGVPPIHGSSTQRVAFENVAANSTGIGSNGIVYGWGDRFYMNCSEASTAGGNIYDRKGSGRLECALLAGCTSQVSVLANIALGNRFTGAALAQGAGASPSDLNDGMVWANNLTLSASGNRCASVTISAAFASRGGYFIQNVFESAKNTNGTAITFNINADGTTGDVYECLDWHNGTFGNRGSRNYSETSGAIGKSRIMSTRFSIFFDWNNKVDTFAALVGGTSSWAYAYDVGNKGNVSMNGSLGGNAPDNSGAVSYLGMYKEPGTNYAADLVTQCAAAFVNPQAGTSTAGVLYGTGNGGGDYHFTANAAANVFKSRVPAGLAVLKFDLDGNVRKNDGSGACGPYEA